jgi:hypothetical protein
MQENASEMIWLLATDNYVACRGRLSNEGVMVRSCFCPWTSLMSETGKDFSLFCLQRISGPVA